MRRADSRFGIVGNAVLPFRRPFGKNRREKILNYKSRRCVKNLDAAFGCIGTNKMLKCHLYLKANVTFILIKN